NNGDGTFVDVTSLSGIFASGTHAFGAVWADMDGDRYPELLVAGDYGTNRYYRNNRDGTFTELDPGSGELTDSDSWTVGKAYNGMGTTVADFNSDGRPDWFVTAIWPTFAYASEFWGNGLYINRGNHIFTEASVAAGVNDGGWGWGVEATDLDNDGHTDLVMTNGWPTGDSVTGASFDNDPSFVWRNRGDARFDDITSGSGLEHSGQGRALLVLDYDRDGDMDIIILSNQASLQLFRNDLIDGSTPRDANWLQVRIDTRANPRLAAHGAGVLITVDTARGRQIKQMTTGGSYLGQSELIAHFGLGSARGVRRVTVDWGNGKKTRLRRVKANQRVTVQSRCRPGPGQPRPINCWRPAAALVK
ncbi:MAG: CRTAC1 family protein, partial [Gammaproteobacteria bacterium]|nr:CRTAC1 family protein [Gammaproteobacteria bacterium]